MTTVIEEIGDLCHRERRHGFTIGLLAGFLAGAIVALAIAQAMLR